MEEHDLRGGGERRKTRKGGVYKTDLHTEVGEWDPLFKMGSLPLKVKKLSEFMKPILVVAYYAKEI